MKGKPPLSPSSYRPPSQKSTLSAAHGYLPNPLFMQMNAYFLSIA